MAADRIAQIRELEAGAARDEAEANRKRWEAARLIAEELQTGKSTRVLAKEIGKSHTHVVRMAGVWRATASGNQVSTTLLPFNRLYKSWQSALRETPAFLGGPVTNRRELGNVEHLVEAVDSLLKWLAASPDELLTAQLGPVIRGQARRLLDALDGKREPTGPEAELYLIRDDGTREPVRIGRRFRGGGAA